LRKYAALALLLAWPALAAISPSAGAAELLSDRQIAGPIARAADADAYIRKLADRTLSILGNRSVTPERRNQALRALLRANLNLALIGRFALGPYSYVADTPKGQEYLSLFGEFIIETYSRRFSEHAVDTMRVTGVRPAGRKDAVVSTYIAGTGLPAVQVDWRVRRNGDRQQIIDVAIGGVSMALTYRYEFVALVERQGGTISGLVKRLRDRLI
jgi:phospholipid transport system substrate-binding protein